ncbi:MAG: AMP-binding protein, partial [Betaproteobacteria bacterium]
LMGSLIAGAGSGLILPTFLSGGMRLVPLEYTATEFLRLISERRVTRLFTTPSLLIDMLDHPNFDRYNPTGLRNLICGTQWMSAQKIEEALRRLGPILQQGCASVEMLPPGSMLQPPERWRDGKIGPRSGLSSVGRVVPQLHAIIADEDDGPSAQAGIGNILIKGPTQFSGYFHQPELTAHGLRRGWLHTANMGYIDTESLPVEEILHDHPAVKETAYAQVGTSAILALSLRHAWRSRLQKPALQQELMEYPSERVSVEDLPDSLHLVNELPRSPLGKALRRKGASCFRPKSAIGRGCLLQNNRFQYG